MSDQPKVTKGMVIDTLQFDPHFIELMRHQGEGVQMTVNAPYFGGVTFYFAATDAYELGESLMEIGDKPDRSIIPADQISVTEHDDWRTGEDDG